MNGTLQTESILGPLDEDVDLLQRILDEIERDYEPGDDIKPEVLRRIEAQLAEMPARIEAIIGLQREHPEIARELERIRNLLSDIEREFNQWPKTADPDTISHLKRICWDGLKELRVLRVPLFINDRKLQRLRIGATLDFLHEYEYDLNEGLGEDMRPQVMKRLKEDKTLLGWVDEEAGVIYRASTDVKRRIGSLAIVFGIPLLGLLGYVIFAPLFQPHDANQPQSGSWNGWFIGMNYLFFIAGYVVHIFKKATEASKDPLLGDIVVWIHVRESQLAWLGVSAWVTYAVMGAFDLFPGLGMFGQITTTTALTAFAAGVSIDSLMAGALKHYDRKVSTQVNTLRSRLLV